MIPIVFLFILGVIAFSEACHHWKDIERHRPINHGYALAFRLAIGYWMFAVLSVTHWLLAEDYRFLLLAPMGWAWWTSIFRFTLNKLRELDWRYVSPSNWYDWQFLKRTWFTADGLITTRDRASIYHTKVYPAGPLYEFANHRAGLYAYVFEALVFSVSIAAYFLLR